MNLDYKQKDLTLLQPSGVEPIRVTRVKSLDMLLSRKNEWNLLAERSQTNTIFQTFEWHMSWWKTFGQEYQLLLLLAEKDERLVGIAPLMLSEQWMLGRKRRIVEFIGTSMGSDYCDFIVDQGQPEVLSLLLQWLVEHNQQWDVLKFSDIPNTSPTLEMLPGLLHRHGYLTDAQVLCEAPTRIFGDSVADQKLLKKKSLRRHYNYFRRNGELEFKNCSTAEEILNYMDLFFEQHIQRWGQTDTPSKFLDKRWRIYYREMVQTLAPTGWLLFSVVLFNQIPIAFHLGFEYGTRVIWYKPTFNVNYARHSPGEVLIKYLLEYALDRKASEFDFTIGEAAFKYRFANHSRLNYEIRVFRNSTLYHTERLLLNAKDLIKRSQTLTRLGRTILKGWKNFRFRNRISNDIG